MYLEERSIDEEKYLEVILFYYLLFLLINFLSRNIFFTAEDSFVILNEWANRLKQESFFSSGVCSYRRRIAVTGTPTSTSTSQPSSATTTSAPTLPPSSVARP